MSGGAYRIEEVPLGGGGTELRLSGSLQFRDAGTLRRDLIHALGGPGGVRVDLSGVERVDGGAAAVLSEVCRDISLAGRDAEIVGATGPVATIMELYSCAGPHRALVAPPVRVPVFEQVGEVTVSLLRTLRGVLDFVGELVNAIGAAIREPRSINWKDVARLMERTGADGVPIVLLILFLLGVVTAFQASVHMHEFGADVFVANLVALSITRELAPLMTAIVIAGRSGAAIAAELGTMTVSEEVDALRTLGFCPHRYLVVPRVLALVLVAPVLTLFGDAIGIGAGMLTVVNTLEISTNSYLESTWDALSLSDVFGGLLKASVFGFLIGMIACERGLSTRRGAEGVGLSTTSAVVSSLFHLVLADVMFTILFERFGL